jgi:hypothetical protein
VRSIEQRREFYTDHPRFGLKDVRVGELDGQIVASLVLYPFTAWVRGQRLAVAGVGSVAVSPEHRRRGVGEALMRATLRELRQSGRALSVLYAFRGSYYRKIGYGVIERVHTLAIAPANLPPSDDARQVRRLMLPDRPAVEALYDRVASQGHFALTRSPEWWEKRLWTYPGDWVVYEGKRRGQIEGYLYYEVDTTHGPFKLAITLGEFVASTPVAHRALVGHLASLADQVQELQFAAPADGAWLEQLRTAHPPPGSLCSLTPGRGRPGDAAGHRREARARGLGAPGTRRDHAGRRDPVLPASAQPLGERAGQAPQDRRGGEGPRACRGSVPRGSRPDRRARSPVARPSTGSSESTLGAAEIAEPGCARPLLPSFAERVLMAIGLHGLARPRALPRHGRDGPHQQRGLRHIRGRAARSTGARFRGRWTTAASRSSSPASGSTSAPRRW